MFEQTIAERGLPGQDPLDAFYFFFNTFVSKAVRGICSATVILLVNAQGLF